MADLVHTRAVNALRRLAGKNGRPFPFGTGDEAVLAYGATVSDDVLLSLRNVGRKSFEYIRGVSFDMYIKERRDHPLINAGMVELQ